jgi:hypothetical protein
MTRQITDIGIKALRSKAKRYESPSMAAAITSWCIRAG